MSQRINVQDLAIRSAAFADQGPIPVAYTGDGEDVSPPLSWTGVSSGTRSYAVVVHDPDAPLLDGFTHWVLYNIPPDVTSLSEADGRFTAGVSSGGEARYMGPAPPPGHGVHHYYFWVYALDNDPELEPGLSRRELFSGRAEHVIEQARTVGTYSR